MKHTDDSLSFSINILSIPLAKQLALWGGVQRQINYSIITVRGPLPLSLLSNQTHERG
jgi:hypothetical protein